MLTTPDALAAPTTFAALGVDADLLAVLDQRGIHNAFPIQAASLPDGLAGRDVTGWAPTGSGKTLAFGLPIVARTGKAQPRRPRALVLAPTRELAAQIAAELAPLGAVRGLHFHTFYGGVGFEPQFRALRRGVDVAVACPGRLADLVSQGAIELGDVEIVVVDEADRMADMGFLPEVKRLLDATSPKRQTLLFSATLDGEVDVLVRRYQHNPARHAVAPPEVGPVDHEMWMVEESERTERSVELLVRRGPAIVFTRTRHGADRLARRLEQAGVASATLHGGRSQGQRDRALEAFRHGHVQALVATDVAARGVHVDGVACVLHYDLPADSKDYTHRSGRTGRAGASGLVVSLVGQSQRRAASAMLRQADVAHLTRQAGDVRSHLASLPALAPRPKTPLPARTDNGASDGPRRERSRSGPRRPGRGGPSDNRRNGSSAPPRGDGQRATTAGANSRGRGRAAGSSSGGYRGR